MSTPGDNPLLASTLSALQWTIHQERFVLVGLPSADRSAALLALEGVRSSFVQYIVEPGAVTLLLPEADWQSICPTVSARGVQTGLRVVSFDADLPEALVGFLAAVSAALAAAGVWLLAVCTFSRDSVVVKEADLDAAIAAFESLRSDRTP